MLTAGSEVDAWCTRCKMDLGHRIVAMVQSQPKRVLCLTCGSEHNFRAPKADAPLKKTRVPGQAARTPRVSLTVASARAEWKKQTESGQPFKKYSIEVTFRKGDLVTHKKFGSGYVLAVLPDKKVSISFYDGEKTLVHAG